MSHRIGAAIFRVSAPSRAKRVAIKLLFAISAALTLVVAPAAAETSRLKFFADEGLCSYEVRFPAERHAAVKGTIELLTEVDGSVDSDSLFVRRPEDIAKLDASKIDRICVDKLSALARMPTLPLSGIEDYRRSLMEEINDTCRYEKIIIAGYRDPAALRTYEASAACSVYIDALEGKADLRAVFDQTVRNQCKTNASPQRCLEKGNSADVVAMKIEVLQFGWHNNCANNFTKRNTMNNSDKKQKLFAQFLRQYRVKKLGCDS